MNVTISINCDSEEEIISHLIKIKSTLKKRFKNNPVKDKLVVEDNNCYGYHKVTIKE